MTKKSIQTKKKDIIIKSLQYILIESNDNLSPETLFNNISNSSGNIESLSTIFEVPSSLIIKIKELNN